jgi:hypothetical protein
VCYLNRTYHLLSTNSVDFSFEKPKFVLPFFMPLNDHPPSPRLAGCSSRWEAKNLEKHDLAASTLVTH